MTKRTTTTKKRRPQSLLRFIVSNGYLAPTQEIKSVLRGDGWWLLASVGRGKSLDMMREACVEAGYLHCDSTYYSDRPATSTIDHLLVAIVDELHGNKLYPAHDWPEDYLMRTDDDRPQEDFDPEAAPIIPEQPYNPEWEDFR